MGFAAPGGDGVVLAVGTKMYGVKKIQGDGLTDLSENWKIAEFDVFGNAGGSEAIFNQGTSLTVSVEANTSPYKAKPTCALSTSTTAESNNLTFVAPPPSPPLQEYPSIVYSESNPAPVGSTPACVPLSGR
jgi:hypothetical protein